MFLRPSVVSSATFSHVTHTIVWCVSVPNGMEIDEVTDEVADEVADEGADEVAAEVADEVGDEVADEVADGFLPHLT